MKSKTLVILSLALLIFSCKKNDDKKSKEKVDNDLSKELLFGKIKSITLTSYDAKESFGELEKVSISKKEITDYNNNGFKTKVTLYDSHGKIDYIEIFKYDLKNNIIEHSFPSSITTYNYDKENRCIQQDELTEERKLKFRSFNKFNTAGKIQEKNTYDKDGKLHSKSIYKYDEHGNEIEESVYKGNGELWWKIVKNYDNLGNMISEEDIQDMFGEKGNKMLYDYNKQKQVIKTSYINPDGTTRYILDTKYDNFGNVINENSISESFINQFTSEYSYSFDKANNWILKKEKSIGPMDRKIIVERTINYFTQ
jgi:hypothetical protein